MTARTTEEQTPAPRHRRLRRWPTAIAMGLLFGGAAALAVYYLAPPDFVATSVVYIEASREPILDADVLPAEDFETYKKTEMYRAVQRSTLETALREPVRIKELQRYGYDAVGDLPLMKAQAYPVDWLGEKMDAVSLSEEFFEIEIAHSDSPMELAEIVNAVTQVYIRDIANESRRSEQRQISTLEGLAFDFERKINSKRDLRKKLSERLGLSDDTTMTRDEQAAQQLTRELHQRWYEQFLELQILRLQVTPAEAPQLNADLIEKSPAAEALIRSLIERELNVASEQMAADRLRADLRLLEETLDDKDHPKLAQTREQLAQLDQKVTELKATVEPTLQATLRDYRQAVHEQESAMRADRMEALTASINKLEAELDRRQHATMRLKGDSYELEMLQAEIDRYQQRLDQLRERIESLKIELSMPDRISLVQFAEVPRIKDWSGLYWKSGLAGGGAFLLAFGLTFVFVPRKRPRPVRVDPEEPAAA